MYGMGCFFFIRILQQIRWSVCNHDVQFCYCPLDGCTTLVDLRGALVPPRQLKYRIYQEIKHLRSLLKIQGAYTHGYISAFVNISIYFHHQFPTDPRVFLFGSV